MTADYDLIDFEMRNSIFDNARYVDVVCMYGVCDVAVHENLARLAVAHSCFWDATVRTAYPEDLRRLALRKDCECIRVLRGGFVRVVCVACHQTLKRICQ